MIHTSISMEKCVGVITIRNTLIFSYRPSWIKRRWIPCFDRSVKMYLKKLETKLSVKKVQSSTSVSILSDQTSTKHIFISFQNRNVRLGYLHIELHVYYMCRTSGSSRVEVIKLRSQSNWNGYNLCLLINRLRYVLKCIINLLTI